jgi:hypothetical protein
MARHLLLLTAGLLATAGPAAAQYPYPYPPPAYGAPASPAGPVLSPYLNLLNGPTGNAGVNYFNFVRPNLQLQQQQQFYGGTGIIAAIDPYPLATNIALDPTGPLPRATGLPSAFMNYGPYFNSMGTIGQPLRGVQPAAAGRAGQAVVPNVPRR